MTDGNVGQRPEDVNARINRENADLLSDTPSSMTGSVAEDRKLLTEWIAAYEAAVPKDRQEQMLADIRSHLFKTTSKVPFDQISKEQLRALHNLFEMAAEQFTADNPRKQAKAAMQFRQAVTPPRIWTYSELCEEWVYIAQMDRFVNIENPNLVLKIKEFDNLYKYAKPQSEAKEHLNTLSAYMFAKPQLTIRKATRAIYLPGAPSGLSPDERFNLYRPSAVVPKEGDTQFWNEHLVYMFPDQESRDHVLNWCAWLLQNMDLKPKHVLLVAGHKHGTGKSFIADTLALILGKHNVSPLGSIELSSSFNKWALASKMLLIEELDALEKNVIKHTLHPIITQETLTINDKSISTYQADNCFGIFAMTNEDAALRLNNEDRRYLVVRTKAVPLTKAYYHDLYSILDDDDALAAIAYELLHRELGDYNGQARAPDTEAKREMIADGRGDVEAWCHEHMHNDPFTRTLVCVEDVEAIMPPRIVNIRGAMTTVRKFMKYDLDGKPLSDALYLAANDRPRAWALHGSYDRVMKMADGEAAKLYLNEREKAKLITDQRAAKQAAEDFTDGDQ